MPSNLRYEQGGGSASQLRTDRKRNHAGAGEKSTSREAHPRSHKRHRRPHHLQVDPSTLPRFLDSTGCVSAGTYSARRLPEMKALWRSFLESKHCADGAPGANAAALLGDDCWNYRSGGRKRSDRHLRRRTGSHNSRARHRFPQGAPPISDELGKRARDAVVAECVKGTSRRARRKPAILSVAHRGWQLPESTATTNWLETHIWHAKRFHMSPPIFGWSIPLAHAGRGTAASLRLAQDGCTVQDATWCIDGGASVLVSPTIEALASVLERVCGAQAEFLAERMVLSGLKLGEGTVHGLDRYPLEVIGPARFLFGTHGGKVQVSIFVHPSIRKDVDVQLRLATADEQDFEVGQIEDGMALIRVRGKTATDAIMKATQPSASLTEDATAGFNWELAKGVSPAHRVLPHGSIFAVNLSPTFGKKSSAVNNPAATISSNSTEEELRRHVTSIGDLFGDEKQKVIPRPYNIDGHNALVVSHCPFSADCDQTHNTAACGWDILCSPKIAKEAFLSLNNDSSACAIGLAEDNHAALEADPPIQSFPRDFPDTQMGRLYWSGGEKSWNVVRCSLELGAKGGRFKTTLKRFMMDLKGGSSIIPNRRLPRIEWGAMTRPMDGNGECELGNEADKIQARVEVVRGAFGLPFVQALHGSGHFESALSKQEDVHDSMQKKRRRPRRRIRPIQRSVRALSLTGEQSMAHEDFCQALLSSLSLPALLRCHVVIEGRGTVEPGACISVRENGTQSCPGKPLRLGLVAAGAFSMSRGSSHGTAFVGAARLLQCLSQCQHHNTAAARHGASGREIAIRAMVRNTSNGSIDRSATLTVLL